jgi:ankyrin repeat protein
MIVAALSGNETAIKYRPILEQRYGSQVIQSAKERSNEILKQIQSAKAERSDYVAPTSLQEAAKTGDLVALKNLLAKGADVNGKDNTGVSALIWAAAQGQGPAAEFLLTNGAAVDAMTEDRSTTLHFAARNGEANVVRLLLKNGAKANAQTASGATPLHLAVKNGSVEIVQALLDGGAEVNLADHDGHTAIYYAASKGDVATVTLLVNRKANVNVVSREPQPPRTPLLIAAWNKHAEVVDLLVKNGAKDNWLSGVPGFDPTDVGALVLSAGKDGTVKVGSLPFFLGAHTAVRPWSAPEKLASRSGGNNLFRWDAQPKGDGSATLIVIQDEHGNKAMADALLPAFIGEGGIIYTDGVSSIGKDGPFAEVQIVWEKKGQSNNDPVSGGSLTITRKGGKVDITTDKDGRCKYVFNHVIGNEPMTVTFKSKDGNEVYHLDFDCVIRGASEHAASFVITKLE